jgi:putative transposase
MSRKPYPSDLSDAQWGKIAHLFPPAKTGGRPPIHTRRELFNAMCYLVRAGCHWRMLPHDFPPHQTVYWYFSEWSKDGTFERIHEVLRMDLRVLSGANPEPTVAIIDSQSVKTTEKGGSPDTMPGRKSRVASAIW